MRLAGEGLSEMTLTLTRRSSRLKRRVVTGNKAMLKILVYSDGKPSSSSALNFAAHLGKRLAAQIAVITVRSGTHATEEPPPVGVDFPMTKRDQLPLGIQILVKAVDDLTTAGLLAPQSSINIRGIPNGYLFVCNTPSGDRIPFYECYGHFIEVLNQEVAEHNYDLAIIAPTPRSSLRRIVLGDTTRILALDLHTSLLVVQGGNIGSRFLVCADGSLSARRIFPMLKNLLPAIRGRIELFWVRAPNADSAQIEAGNSDLEHARAWLEKLGKHPALHQTEGRHPLDLILEAAGNDSVVVMGASLRHDVYRRMLGSLPIQVLSKTESSVLLVKLPPEADVDFFQDPFVI